MGKPLATIPELPAHLESDPLPRLRFFTVLLFLLRHFVYGYMLLALDKKLQPHAPFSLPGMCSSKKVAFLIYTTISVAVEVLPRLCSAHS